MDKKCLNSSKSSIPFPPRFELQGVLLKDNNAHVETGNDEYEKQGDHEESLRDDFEDDVLQEAKKSCELRKMLGLSSKK